MRCLLNPPGQATCKQKRGVVGSEISISLDVGVLLDGVTGAGAGEEPYGS